jgi:hypothetical protein
VFAKDESNGVRRLMPGFFDDERDLFSFRHFVSLVSF